MSKATWDDAVKAWDDIVIAYYEFAEANEWNPGLIEIARQMIWDGTGRRA